MADHDGDSGLSDTQARYLAELIRSGRIVVLHGDAVEPLPVRFCPSCSKAAEHAWDKACSACNRIYDAAPQPPAIRP